MNLALGLSAHPDIFVSTTVRGAFSGNAKELNCWVQRSCWTPIRTNIEFLGEASHPHKISFLGGFDYSLRCILQGNAKGLNYVGPKVMLGHGWAFISTYSKWRIIYIRLSAHTAIIIWKRWRVPPTSPLRPDKRA
jgi:hypothetical protein